jgi:hypothetical protein
MHHLTNYYRNLSEQLQEKINILEKQLLHKTKLLVSEDLQWNLGARLPSEEETFVQKMADAEKIQNQSEMEKGPKSSNRIQLASNIMRMLNDPDHPVHKDEVRKEQLMSLLAYLNTQQNPPPSSPPTTGSQEY